MIFFLCFSALHGKKKEKTSLDHFQLFFTLCIFSFLIFLSRFYFFIFWIFHFSKGTHTLIYTLLCALAVHSSIRIFIEISKLKALWSSLNINTKKNNSTNKKTFDISRLRFSTELTLRSVVSCIPALAALRIQRR